MKVEIRYCGDDYIGTWRHGLWKVTTTLTSDHVIRFEGRYFKHIEVAEFYKKELEKTS